MALNAVKLPAKGGARGGSYKAYLQSFSPTGSMKGGNNPQNVTFIAPIKAKKFKYNLVVNSGSDGTQFYVYLLSRNASGSIEATQVLQIYTTGGNTYTSEIDVDGEFVGLRYKTNYPNYSYGSFSKASYFEVSA